MEWWHWLLAYVAVSYPAGAVFLGWVFGDQFGTPSKDAAQISAGAIWLISPVIPLVLAISAVGWIVGLLIARCSKR